MKFTKSLDSKKELGNTKQGFPHNFRKEDDKNG
jgi:hypothetical protein